MLRKLRVKFVLVNMAIVTLMLCVIFGMNYHFTRLGLENRSLDMMRTVATDPFRFGRRSDTETSQTHLPYMTVWLGSGGEVVTVNGYYALTDENILHSLIETAQAGASPTGVLEDYGLRYLRLAQQGRGCIVFADITSERATLSSIARNSVGIGLTAFAVFLAVSILLSRWAVKPVERSWQQQRQFVADASHELKTPLTVIAANAELLQEPGYDAADRARFSAGILTMAQQMRGLVEQLLSLARADSTQQTSPMTTLDLSVLAENALLPFEPVFFERGLTLNSRIEPGLSVLGCESELQQMVRILLDNASKYADTPGRVEVTLVRHKRSHCILTVSDTGKPIPPEVLPHLFERFYRADSARSRDGSFGLGLSIAQAVAIRHKGRIWAESKDGWNRFCVELPVHGR